MRIGTLPWLALLCLCAALGARAEKLILNEYNAVSPANVLEGGGFDPYFGPAAVTGNGGNWFELVVVADHLDVRGWKLQICDNSVCNEQLVFSQNALWADLRAGTIITVAEDVATDVSYNPIAVGGDWWINVQASDAGPSTYITPNSFPVSNDDWQLTIRDAADVLVFGPAGEGIASNPAIGCNPPSVGVNSREVFKLETAPSALVDRCSTSYNDGTTSRFGAPNAWGGGVLVQDLSALRLGLPIPDRDTDGVADDGNRSGIAGDATCTGGATSGCDDNCPGEANSNQADSGGIAPGGANGIGDACECGDVDDDGDVDANDRAHLRAKLSAQLPNVDAPAKCGVVNDGACNVADASVTRRVNQGLPPDIAPVCPAAALPADPAALWYDPERLLEIEITMARGDWNDLRVQARDLFSVFLNQTCGDTPFPDPYTFFSAPTVLVEGQPLVDVGIRKKGFFGSLSETKPSLKLDFGEFVSGQRLEGLDRMTLNNALQDPAYVKQCLGYAIMAEAGIPAPRCNFARVTLHTTQSGTPDETPIDDLLYVNVESIKEPFLGRVFGDPSGRLYEGTLSDFWLKGTPATGEPWRGTIEPKDDPAAANKTEIDALTAALVNTTYTDAERRAAIEAVVDLDAYLTFWAGEGLIGHWDGYADDQNNFYFYVKPLEGKIHFIPWGADDTFGRGNPLSGRTGDPVHAQAIVPRAALPRRLYAIPAVRTLYLAKLQHLLDTVWNPTAHLAEIDRMQALIQPVTGDLTTALAPIRTWINDHRARVQAEIDTPTAGFAAQPDHFCFFD